MLPIQRWSPSVGAYVPCWLMPQPPPVSVSSYQRMPARFDPAVTVWSTTIVCQPPKFRYASRCISRSESGSRPTLVPGCGMQFHEPPQRFELKGVVESSVSCVTLREGALQSIVPLHTLRRSGAPSRMETSGIAAPAGGAVEPSASAGSSEPRLESTSYMSL